MNYISLLEANNLVRQSIELTLQEPLWVLAELASVNDRRGHCYMELIEKGPTGNTPVAQARACCWASVWFSLGPRFQRATGQPLHAGMKVLLQVRANFHEAYGFSWIVQDIDPTFTLGDMARRRKEILEQLRQEGVIDNNRSLAISPFATRIAVISSSTAAGYGDFASQLANNDYGFAFSTRLFPAVMQGEQVEQSIIAALDNVFESIDDFDAVVIIRGGGSNADLSGFDTLELAENVANFPIPVITGIGHERDKTVLDEVACISVKTPTAVAAYLIDNLSRTLARIDSAAEAISVATRRTLERERLRLARLEHYFLSAFSVKKVHLLSRLQSYEQRIHSAARHQLLVQRNMLDAHQRTISHCAATNIARERSRLDLLEQRINSANPMNVLKRGYSLVMHNGTIVTDPKQVKTNDDLTIMLHKGVIDATVK
ncbi:MAG: exodeoxyribonuclease VII large subunit [Prevotella sp.]|nr:exodeoxyribonuclease VII large subunit [Prevotella sp.]